MRFMVDPAEGKRQVWQYTRCAGVRSHRPELPKSARSRKGHEAIHPRLWETHYYTKNALRSQRLTLQGALYRVSDVSPQTVDNRVFPIVSDVESGRSKKTFPQYER